MAVKVSSKIYCSNATFPAHTAIALTSTIAQLNLAVFRRAGVLNPLSVEFVCITYERFS